MHSIFSKHPHNQSIITPPRHNYINDKVESTVTKSIYNYRRSTYFVDADHILVRILQQLGISYDNNDRIYYSQIEDRTSRIAAAVGFSDYNAKPNLNHKNSFFDPKVREYVVSITNGFTPLISLPNLWQEFTPVKVLYHPYNDMACNIRDGSRSDVITGHAVITVDIPLLALQFLKWKNWARQNLEVMPTIEQFVYQYPLVNMLRSDINVSYYNHLGSTMRGQSITPQRRKYGFTVPDIEPYMGDDVNYVINAAAVKPRNITDLAQSIMLFDGLTVWDFLQLPPVAIGTGNAGVLALGTLPWIATLAQLSFQSNSKDNGTIRNQLTRRFRNLRDGGYFRIDGIENKYIEAMFTQDVLPYL